MNNSVYKPDATRSEVVDISKPISIVSIGNVAVVPNSVKEQTSGIKASDASIVVSKRSVNRSHTIEATTFLSNYNSNTSYYNSSILSNYKLKRNGQIIEGKNNVNYYDGVSLLCKDDGTPFGFDELRLYSISASVSSVSDVYYSNISLAKIDGENPGLVYGFYDTSINEFIGKEITYLRYSSNPQSIYIGVYAYDYDGNLNTQKEYSSASNGTVYHPVNVPVLAAYPVFNVITKARNKIQLLSSPQNLLKTEPWPISVTSGSFNKTVSLDSKNLTGWMAKYKRQFLTAFYDTASLPDVSWSKIYGTGYSDIVAEKPIYNGSRSITLRSTPIHCVQTIANGEYKKSSKIKPIVKVYLREDVNSPWTLVPESYIRDININTGVIEFKSGNIPSNEELIKVDYTVKSNYVNIKQVNGSPVALNPFLFKDDVKINKPIYVYIVPKKIYKEQNYQNQLGQSRKIEVEEYSETSFVKYTYDNNIFNKLDKFSYNPFAILIGIIYVTDTNEDQSFSFSDLRVKGGGVSSSFNTNTVLDNINEAISFWDVYPPMSEAYPKGGYVMIKIPSSVKKNFINPQEVYDIIKSNLTAGVIFDLVDMNGNDWGSSVTISS